MTSVENLVQKALAEKNPTLLSPHVSDLLDDPILRIALARAVSTSPLLVTPEMLVSMHKKEDPNVNAAVVDAVLAMDEAGALSFLKRVCTMDGSKSAARLVCAVAFRNVARGGALKAGLYACARDFPEGTDTCWRTLALPTDKIADAVHGAIKEDHSAAGFSWLSMDVSRSINSADHVQFWVPFVEGDLLAGVETPSLAVFEKLEGGKMRPTEVWQHASLALMQGVVPSAAQFEKLRKMLGEAATRARDHAIENGTDLAKSLWAQQ